MFQLCERTRHNNVHTPSQTAALRPAARKAYDLLRKRGGGEWNYIPHPQLTARRIQTRWRGEPPTSSRPLTSCSYCGEFGNLRGRAGSGLDLDFHKVFARNKFRAKLPDCAAEAVLSNPRGRQTLSLHATDWGGGMHGSPSSLHVDCGCVSRRPRRGGI